MTNVRLWLALVMVALLVLMGLSVAAVAGENPQASAQGDGAFQRVGEAGSETCAAAERRARSQLGIGFLWTIQSQPVANKLTSEKDFVDLILGPGKLDVFEKVKPPVRVVCLARSLEKDPGRPFPGLRETIEMLRKGNIAAERVVLGYNPEGQPGTPTKELDQLADSVRTARKMAQDYGAPLLVGPGLRDMERREHLYPELAKSCDIWMIQSQRLQLDAVSRKPVPVAVYREKVKAIADRLREGNPKIQIYVQVVTTAERGAAVMTADEIARFARGVEDVVDSVRIYGASAELLSQIIEKLHAPRLDASPSQNGKSPSENGTDKS